MVLCVWPVWRWICGYTYTHIHIYTDIYTQLFMIGADVAFVVSLAFVVGGLGFEFCVFVAGWRHALRSEWRGEVKGRQRAGGGVDVRGRQVGRAVECKIRAGRRRADRKSVV